MKRIAMILTYIIGGIVMMFIGGALLSILPPLFTLIVAAVALAGGFYFRWIRPFRQIYLLFFSIALAAGFSVWLQNN